MRIKWAGHVAYIWENEIKRIIWAYHLKEADLSWGHWIELTKWYLKLNMGPAPVACVEQAKVHIGLHQRRLSPCIELSHAKFKYVCLKGEVYTRVNIVFLKNVCFLA